MFWRFGGYANISTIDTLLDKPDITLEELLDEPEIIQELKQLNTKLIEYLREDHVLKRLMDYVTAPSLVSDDEENDEDDAKDASKKDKDAAASADQTDTDEEKEGDPLRDILDPDDLDKVEKNRLKHAYIACEILSSETWSILESMMANPSYLRDFWGFLRRSPPLDSLQASYFTKVNETLLDKKTEEMLEFLKTLDGIVPALLQHVDNPMVMDLLLKIISLEKAEGGQGTVDWLKSQDLIPNLLCFLSPDRPASVQTSAGDFLKAIITISANASPNDQSCIGPNSLTRQLVSTQCVQQLIDAMLMGGNPLTVGVGIVIEVIRKNNSDYDPESLGGPDTMLTTYDPIYLGTLLRLFAKHIPQFMALIQSSQHTIHDGNKLKTVERGKLSSAWGGQIEPLGFDRFKTCELMAELLHCSNMGLLNEPGSDEYVKQRDEERERLIREGVFNPHQDENSGIDCNDTTADFANDSAFDSGSPEDTKTTEAPRAGEEEGFEDVGASGVLVGAKAGADTTTSANSQSTETVSEIPPSDITAAKSMSPEETTNPSQTSTAAIDPASPTIGLPDQVGSMNLENEPQDEQQKPGKDSQEPVASSSQDVPASLFLKEQGSESNPPPADQSEETSSVTAQAEETSIMNDGGDEDSAEQYIQLDTDGRPVVGDYLKIQFVENKVVPTILGFFFRFPWNNFLHNVVYDVIQQVFNGPMERGYNRALAVNVFDIGRITTAIVEGQKRSDETQRTKQIRLGYMGHLTLVAEEVVKFSERHPPELLSRAVMESVLNPDWIEYVEQTLSETRERDNAILGGVRPDMSGSRQTSLNNTNSGQGFSNSNALSDAGLNGGIGGSNFQSFDLSQGSVSGGAFGGGGTSLLSGFASSSDDDEDEEMEDQDDRDSGNADQGDTDNVLTSSASQPIPILPPPPAPLSLGPSRARRQLAARLAAQKQQSSDNDEGDGEDRGTEESGDRESDWPSNPFVIAGIDDDAEGGNSAFPNSDFGSANAKHSPTFPESGFSPPDSLSTNSSEDEGDGHAESVRRQVRVPLEVEDDDDDEMGEMVGPSGIGMMDSDDEDEAIINESLGYSNLSGPGRYNNFRRTRAVSSHYDDEQNDSSDGEDDGLVEIVVPGRKSSTSN
ncbi:SIT4 phosphatase-associated protein family [Penicillium cf. griseofulvum]|uniref:SIT4 phosphatase-associated protein family n=1 Tax=Penicillium cf. griseofulvum TaxID=2972120 RepID=A0A9W9MR41_9EURO|nr:SIT4 phosphatase-associated protein family [Penicillium cf. griseofulvum]KAJ5441070.1 SIT4 phosphatase-associated protein family [Penicillium cf. griseofulvum]